MLWRSCHHCSRTWYAAINGDAMKKLAGALSSVPICREFNLKATIDFLKNSGIQVVACTEKTEDLIYAPDDTIPKAIIMGSEEDGISEEYLKLCLTNKKSQCWVTSVH